MHDINDIFCPGVYEKEILHQRRHRQNGIAIIPGANGDDFNLFRHRKGLSRRLAALVKKGEYRLSPMVRYRINVDDKVRILYRQAPLDIIVSRVLFRIVTDRMASFLSDRVFSYRKGMSGISAIAQLHRFVVAHIAARPDRQTRGLYVLKRDISLYSESIATDPSSRLWSLLEEVFRRDQSFSRQHFFWTLLQAIMRPRIVDEDGEEKLLEIGVPSGTTLQTVACNLYLNDLDRRLEGIDGGFYARYGDDFIFVHPDWEVARQVAGLIDEQVATLRLSMKPAKVKNQYFTGPGRPSSEWREAIPSSVIEYLGYRLSFGGSVGLKKDKARRLQQDIRARLSATLKLLRDEPREVRLQAACDAVNAALDPHSPLCQRNAAMLAFIINDRRQLRHLDYLIALEVARAASGVKGVRAFRQVPYRELRGHYGLHSLVHARNCIGRGERA
mgnify:FL=1